MPVEAVRQPSAIRSLPVEHDPAQYREMVYRNPSSEEVRWWRAHMDPTYSPANALPASGSEKWLHVEQTGLEGLRAVVQGAETQTKYLAQGSWQSGDIVVTTMPDELPLDSHDWICPVGRSGSAVGQVLDARAVTYKEVLTRGGFEVAMAGTVTSTSTAVVGSGTAFLSLRSGDAIKAGGQSRRVSVVTDATHITLETAPSPAWAANSLVQLVDRPSRTPAAVVDYLNDGTTTYVAGRDFAISSDGSLIGWQSVSGSPAIGARYSVIYRYFPRYVVLPDGVLRRHSVNGVALPQRVIARLLWAPEALTR